MDRDERDRLTERYRLGADAVVAAWHEVPAGARDRLPAPGEWSARQVVHHLADSETTSYLRLRALIAEDEPTIHAYDENRYAARLHYDRPPDRSLALLSAVRAASLELVEVLSDDDLARTGTHTESGRYSVADWLRIYAQHPYDHAQQIRVAAGLAEPARS